MKPERTQDRFKRLEGWELIPKGSQNLTGEEEPKALWTAFELADHQEACEMVPELGRLADRTCATPDIDVRRNIVFVTVSTGDSLTDEDFDFAEAVDREIGDGQRAKSLIQG